MPVDLELLTALQYADSLFPSGGSSFSWGLEPLYRDGLIGSAADVASYVRTLIHGRWQPFDRPIMQAAHKALNDPRTWLNLDEQVERMSMATELRDGSKRAGAALLAIHTQLETPGASEFYRQVRASALLGHLNVVQGVVWRGVGLSEAAACAMSAHGLVTGMLSAALRLNVIGHATAQAMRRELQTDIADALDKSPCALNSVSSFAPLAEIAAMRHSEQPMRLFAT